MLKTQYQHKQASHFFFLASLEKRYKIKNLKPVILAYQPISQKHPGLMP